MKSYLYILSLRTCINGLKRPNTDKISKRDRLGYVILHYEAIISTPNPNPNPNPARARGKSKKLSSVSLVSKLLIFNNFQAVFWPVFILVRFKKSKVLFMKNFNLKF